MLPIEKTSYAENIYWVYGIVLKKDTNIDNKEMQQPLAKERIGTSTFFWCMHKQTIYRKEGLFSDESYPNAEYLARKGFYIPSGLALTKDQMDRVIEAVKKVMKQIQ